MFMFFMGIVVTVLVAVLCLINFLKRTGNQITITKNGIVYVKLGDLLIFRLLREFLKRNKENNDK